MTLWNGLELPESYFHDDDVYIIKGDCREVSLHGTVLTDPPYNIGHHYDNYKDNIPEDNYFSLLGHLCRTPSVVIHYIESLFRLSWVLEEIPCKVVSWVYPSNTARQWRGVAYFGTPIPDFTSMGQDYKNPNDTRIKKLIAQGKSARLYDWWEVNQVKNVSRQKTEHPCQIPEIIIQRIIKSLPNETLFTDPFLGSGTTIVCTRKENRKCIGIEISEEYCEIAAIRYLRSLND